jgi:hypothetical protein
MVTTVILLWIIKTTMWLRRVCCMYWFCGCWPKKLIVTQLKQLHASYIVQCVIRTYCWTLSCLRFTLLYSTLTRRPSIGLPSDYLIKVLSAFLIPLCLPRVLRISSHLWFCYPNNICWKLLFFFNFSHNHLIASALDPDILKISLICVDPIKIACMLKPSHVAMVKNTGWFLRY